MTPDPSERVVLAVPDITRLRRYMFTYYASALKHVLKQHRLLVDRRFPAYEIAFTFTTDEQTRWLRLFETTELATPFTYDTTVRTMGLMRVVGDLGVNFKNLMHLKVEMVMAPAHRMDPERTYRNVSEIEDIIALSDSRVALVCASRIYDESGYPIRTYRDFFVILNLEPQYVEALRAAKDYGHLDAEEFHGLASRQPTLTDTDPAAHRVAVDVPQDLGLRYGRVSGDLNVVHTTRLAAKIFGHPRPFIQGLCTANHVLRHLTPVYGAPEAFRITFAKRVFVGQQIELRHLQGQFEVCDARGALLAFGDFDPRRPSASR